MVIQCYAPLVPLNGLIGESRRTVKRSIPHVTLKFLKNKL